MAELKCLCPRCRGPNAPHAERGTPEFLYSDLHRRECEARGMLRLDKEARQHYYQMVLAARGRQAAKLLIHDVEAENAKRGMREVPNPGASGGLHAPELPAANHG